MMAEEGRCVLCPRRCGVDRRAGEKGYCRAGDALEIYRSGAHHGEEPPLSGHRGSGTVFFSRCTLRCLYCQNYPFSQEGRGARHTEADLVGLLRALAEAGCHNWNLVSPTPWLPLIVPAVRRARAEGPALPVVYNTSGYERVDTLRALEGEVAIYLPDLRYATATAGAAGSEAPDYAETARAAVLEMWRQVGPLRTDAEGIARSGVICRLLILPGLAEEACANLRWLAETIGTGIAISVMAQYTPAHRARERSPWRRRITRAEYDTVARCVERLGFTEGWVQAFERPTDAALVGFNMPAGGLAAGGTPAETDKEITR